MKDSHDNHALPYLVALAMVLAILMAGSTLIAAEPKPELWVYSASWCGPCQRLHRDQESGKALRGFTVHYIDAPKGMYGGIPCIAYWKANGHPGYFHGWGPSGARDFLSQYKRDQKGG